MTVQFMRNAVFFSSENLPGCYSAFQVYATALSNHAIMVIINLIIRSNGSANVGGEFHELTCSSAFA